MKIVSMCTEVGAVDIPRVDEEISMIPFNLKTLEGLPEKFKNLVESMVSHLKVREGLAHFTIHGAELKAGDTLRRGGAHTDGSYDECLRSWGGNGGWKLGENGTSINSELHNRLYNNPKGGIILASTFPSCLAYEGVFEGEIGVGGDCTKLDLPEPKMLEAGKVYYGNNHFVHESIPVSEDTHRTFARVTLPETHEFETKH